MTMLKLDDLKDLLDSSDLFDIVVEPEYSKNRLLHFQNKYGIFSETFYNYYEQIPDLISKIENKDISEWIYSYEMFINSGGNLWELKESINIENDNATDNIQI